MTVGGDPNTNDLDSVRLELEAVEDSVLAPYATRSAASLGRETAEPESPVRTSFQRDRDRIIHSNSFRRLRAKTQVFIAPTGDHYATRLSHALEVAQISRVIARALRLNEDLAEAIALAHDLGHAPFGHAGQEALNRILGDGYRHDEQSVRVVRYLEKGGRGLNLTLEVLDGIRSHRKPRHNLAAYAVAPSSTLEAEVVRLSDAVAYINHDVDDAERSGLIDQNDLPAEPIETLGRSRSERINTVVCDIVATSRDHPYVHMSEPCLMALNSLRDYLFDAVYRSPALLQESMRAQRLVENLFSYYVQEPDAMPEEFQNDPRNEGIERRVADYIAGMTDYYAIRLCEGLHVPGMGPA
ncbi:MAG TPA: deoxyguanosinetriphosphate triphosphohydrolase [Chloroflexota bacterium]